MKIEILGNGTKFNVKSTNTSFIIDDEILVNCGYNVFQKLVQRNIIEDLNVVFVTDTSFHHIGSLEPFILYRWEKYELPTTIVSNASVIKELKCILANTGKEYENGEIVDIPMIQFLTLKENSEIDVPGSYHMKALPLKTFNPGRNSSGFIFRKRKKAVIVTGETIANKYIKEKFEVESGISKLVYVFHEFIDKREDVFLTKYKDIKEKTNVRIIIVGDDTKKEGVFIMEKTEKKAPKIDISSLELPKEEKRKSIFD